MKLGRLFVLGVISAVILYLIEDSFWWILTVMAIGGILTFLGTAWAQLREEQDNE